MKTLFCHFMYSAMYLSSMSFISVIDNGGLKDGSAEYKLFLFKKNFCSHHHYVPCQVEQAVMFHHTNLSSGF